MKNIVLFTSILLSILQLNAQNNAEHLLLGKWVLTGIKTEYYNSLIDDFPLVNVSDTALKLIVDEEHILFIENHFYYSPDSNLLNYEIHTDSTGNLELQVFNQKKRKRSNQDNFDIVKLNNSSLCLSNISLSIGRPFFHYPKTLFYFQKSSDSLSISEENFSGKWFCSISLRKAFINDTVTLTRDSIAANKENTTKKFIINFTIEPEAMDSFVSNEFMVREPIAFFHQGKGTWLFSPEEETLQITYKGQESRTYTYLYSKDKITLCRKL